MTVDPNGVAAFLLVRQPHSSMYDGTCPACGACDDTRRHVKYVDQKRQRTANGEWILLSGGMHDPHLIVTCDRCDFWWESEVWTP